MTIAKLYCHSDVDDFRVSRDKKACWVVLDLYGGCLVVIKVVNHGCLSFLHVEFHLFFFFFIISMVNGLIV